MNAQELFQTTDAYPETIDGQLDASTPELFANQYRTLFLKKSDRRAKGLVYIYWTTKLIPRLKDASNIVYIGQTKHSLATRLAKYAKDESTGGNWERYEHIIRTYGPIRISYVLQSQPRKTESSLLLRYFHSHLEAPPLNGTTK